jgi:hypothetical protein
VKGPLYIDGAGEVVGRDMGTVPIVKPGFVSGCQKGIFFSDLIDGNITHNSKQPGFTTGPIFELIKLAIGPQVGFLNKIFRVPSGTGDGQGKTVEGVKMGKGYISELMLHTEILLLGGLGSRD